MELLDVQGLGRAEQPHQHRSVLGMPFAKLGAGLQRVKGLPVTFTRRASSSVMSLGTEFVLDLY